MNSGSRPTITRVKPLITRIDTPQECDWQSRLYFYIESLLYPSRHRFRTEGTKAPDPPPRDAYKLVWSSLVGAAFGGTSTGKSPAQTELAPWRSGASTARNPTE